MSGAPQEIERVYLLSGLPELPPGAEPWRIEQGYLPEHELDAPDCLEGRVRRKTAPTGKTSYVHTIKRGQGLVREETERAIDAAEFEAAWGRTLGRRISKTRHRVREGELVWEVDVFDELPLVMAEVELPYAEYPVELPAWLAPHVVRELTEDSRYRNFALATEGLPPDHPAG
ncbi:MAG: adenylate cyclase [Planctomycetota bacterium]